MHAVKCYQCIAQEVHKLPLRRCDYCACHYPLAIVNTTRSNERTYVATFGSVLPNMHAFSDRDFLQGCPGLPLVLTEFCIERFITFPSLTTMGVRPIDPFSAGCIDTGQHWTLGLYQLGIYRYIKRFMLSECAEVYRCLSIVAGRKKSEVVDLMNAYCPLGSLEVHTQVATECLDALVAAGLVRVLESTPGDGEIPNHIVPAEFQRALTSHYEDDSIEEVYFRWLPHISTYVIAGIIARIKAVGETTTIAETLASLQHLMHIETINLLLNQRTLFYQNYVVDTVVEYLTTLADECHTTLSQEHVRSISNAILDKIITHPLLPSLGRGVSPPSPVPSSPSASASSHSPTVLQSSKRLASQMIFESQEVIAQHLSASQQNVVFEGEEEIEEVSEDTVTTTVTIPAHLLHSSKKRRLDIIGIPVGGSGNSNRSVLGPPTRGH